MKGDRRARCSTLRTSSWLLSLVSEKRMLLLPPPRTNRKDEPDGEGNSGLKAAAPASSRLAMSSARSCYDLSPLVTT